MIRNALVVFALVSVFFFPTLFTVLLVLAAAIVSPFVPLAAGLLAEALYGAPHAYAFPLYALWGLIASVVAFLVHRFVETSIIR